MNEPLALPAGQTLADVAEQARDQIALILDADPYNVAAARLVDQLTAEALDQARHWNIDLDYEGRRAFTAGMLAGATVVIQSPDQLSGTFVAVTMAARIARASEQLREGGI